MKKFANVTLCAATLLSVATGVFETTVVQAESQNTQTVLTSSQAPDGIRVFELGTIDHPVTYTAGEEVFYEGKIYQVLQTHKNSGENWTPDNTPTLFMYLRTPEEPSTPPTEEAKQRLDLGGEGVKNGDATHQDGFARLTVGMTDGKLSLIKDSQYDFNKDFAGEKYASVTVKDATGKVLYDKTWNGDQDISDLPDGKYGEFASYDLEDGSMVTIYHAEGDTTRYTTSDNDALKTHPGKTYTYIVKGGQLIPYEEPKQELLLGGPGVKNGDTAHQDGFGRLSVKMTDGTLTLAKNSQYAFNKDFAGKKYAALTVKDVNGKVLYDKTWNGDQSISDLPDGKYGNFASYDLKDGSTVTIYHAEGDTTRYTTSDNDALKTHPGKTYTYIVKEGQLIPYEEPKQELLLGGEGVKNGDAAHQDGFGRLSIKMTDGTLTLAKNSQYAFNKDFAGKKYATLTVKDANGKVLYDKTWNGDQNISDLPDGKYGDFASYDLKDGSTVTIYHAEGNTNRFNTTDNDALKAQTEMTYNYVVKEGQLVLVKEDPSTPPTEKVTQTINFGGPAQVNGDASHQEGFPRLILTMTDGTLTLNKSSDREFNNDFPGKKYAAVTVKDADGKVLYDKTWNGDQAVADLPHGEFGDFASYDLKDGSTVTIYHAEGNTNRLNTSDNDALKAAQPGPAYHYVVKEGQLTFVKEETPTPPAEIPDLNGKTVNIVSALNNSVLEYRDNGKGIAERIFIGDKNGATGDSGQQWTLYRVSPEEDRYNQFGCDENTYYLVNQSDSITNADRYLDQDYNKRGAVYLVSSIYMHFETTWWRVEKTDTNGVYRIFSPYSKTVLDVSDDGASVEKTDAITNQADQQWKINIIK